MGLIQDYPDDWWLRMKSSKPEQKAAKRPRAVMLKITQQEIDWFFSRQECCFADKEKARQICEMRLQGLTYKEIGEKFNLSWDKARLCVKQVHEAYERAMWREDVK